MGEVVGFKGTADDRLLSWMTMLMLRKTLAWAKTAKVNLPSEEDWLKTELDNYRKVA